MNNISALTASTGASTAGIGQGGQAKFNTPSAEQGDGVEFRAALERQMNANGGPKPNAANENSLGEKIMVRATNLAGEVKKDQQYVSSMLEQATRNADSIQLMKAMMALNDYQMRVQFISKTASKATSSLDQLTKLQ